MSSNASKILGDRNRLVMGLEGPRNVSTSGYYATYSGLDSYDIFSIEKFKSKAVLDVKENTYNQLVFDLIGVDTSIVNAIRRILISEVPSMAIETVQIWQNTGVIQDEILAHRLGLIPFIVDSEQFEMKGENEELNERNSLCFSLHIKCTENDVTIDRNYLPIYAKDLIWEPLTPLQREKYSSNPPRVVEDKILITKLGCGQEIELKCYLEKGIGKTHAKWSPVATATYRLHPEIIINEDSPFTPQEITELLEIAPKGIFSVKDGQLIVKNIRFHGDIRHCAERFPDKLTIRKIKDHFIFTIESSGVMPAQQLFKMALQRLKEKVSTVLLNLDTSSYK